MAGSVDTSLSVENLQMGAMMQLTPGTIIIHSATYNLADLEQTSYLYLPCEEGAQQSDLRSKNNERHGVESCSRNI